MSSSSRHKLEEALARIVDPALEGARSCLTVYAESARRAADAADGRARDGRSLGPLDGAVITIKDLFDVAGEVTRAGSPALARRSEPAASDAVVVERLRAAGAVIVAKTNMTELAFSGVGVNPHFGTPGNPADRGRIPGGSTSGGAVACADGIGELAIGSDTGGSTRIPAALCGLVGFKPTARRISTRGAHPLSTTLDSMGPIAHSVATCHVADAVMAGDASEPLAAVDLSQLRVGVLQGMVLDELDAGVAACFERTLRTLQAVRLRDIRSDAIDAMNRVNARGGIVPVEAFALHRRLMDQASDEIDPFVRRRILAAAGMSAADYIENLRDRSLAIAHMDRVFDEHDVIALPTTPIVAPRLNEVATADGFAANNRLLLRNTSVANFLDLCAISLPMRCGQPLPCGLMLLGRSGADATLFRIAAAVEAALSPY